MIEQEECRHWGLDRKDLTEKFKREGIGHMLFDFDDTLIDTQHIFGYSIKNFAEEISTAAEKQISAEAIELRFREILEGLRPEFGIHPGIMQIAASITAQNYDLDPSSTGIKEATEGLMKLYRGNEAVPFEGTTDALKMISASGVDPILVTHASEDFTWGKLRAAKLLGTFASIFCIPTHKHKDEEAWRYVISELGQTPDGIYVVGDSWNSDIKPVLALGVPSAQVLRVSSRWVAANHGAIEGVQEIPDISHLIPVLLKGDQ